MADLMTVRQRTMRFLVYYGRVLAVVLLVCGICAAAAAGYVYTHPPSEQVTEETNPQEVHTALATSATVTGNTTLYDRGQRLENQPAYILNATPTIGFALQTDGITGNGATVSHRVSVELTATRDDEAFWQERRLLIAERAIVQDEVAVSTADVDMRALGDHITARRNQIGEIGEFSAAVHLNTTYTTGPYRGRLTASAPLVVTSRAFWINGDLTERRSHSQSTTRTVTRAPDPVTSLGLLGVGLACLLGVLGIGYVRRLDIDVYEIERALAEAEHEDWISEGQVPTDPDRKYIPIESLEDLVDIAIDSSKRVIHDREYQVYSVTDGDIVYHYSHGEFNVDSWLNM